MSQTRPLTSSSRTLFIASVWVCLQTETGMSSSSSTFRGVIKQLGVMAWSESGKRRASLREAEGIQQDSQKVVVFSRAEDGLFTIKLRLFVFVCYLYCPKGCRNVKTPHLLDLPHPRCHFPATPGCGIYHKLSPWRHEKQVAFARRRKPLTGNNDHLANSKWAFKCRRLSLGICLSPSCTHGSFLFSSSQLLIYEGIKYDTCVTGKSRLGLNRR